jgi:hypothetical protein
LPIKAPHEEIGQKEGPGRLCSLETTLQGSNPCAVTRWLKEKIKPSRSASREETNTRDDVGGLLTPPSITREEGMELPGSEKGESSPGSAPGRYRREGHALEKMATPAASMASSDVAQATEELTRTSPPTVQERRRRSTAKLFCSVLDLYPMKFLHTNERVVGKAQARCSRTKEEMKTEDADKENGQRQAMELSRQR